MARMLIDLRIGESLEIEGGIVVSLQQKSGQLARLCFERPTPMEIRKQEDRRTSPREGSPGRRSADRK